MERFPKDDETLGNHLFDLLKQGLDKGMPRPALLVLRPAEVSQFDLVPLLQTPVHHRQRMMAAIAGQEGVECAAVVAVLQLRQRGQPKDRPPTKVAAVYVEWPNNRWWTAWQPLGPERKLVGDSAIVRHAVDGWPRPSGIGGWFALARRERLQLRLDRPGHQAGMSLVH